MSFELVIYRNRTQDFSVTIFEADGETAVDVAEDDVVRFKLGRGDGAMPVLDLSSAAATGNGSSISAENPAQLRLAQADLAELPPGVYEAEVGLVDVSETTPPDAFRHAASGTVHVLPSLGGAIGT